MIEVCHFSDYSNIRLIELWVFREKSSFRMIDFFFLNNSNVAHCIVQSPGVSFARPTSSLFGCLFWFLQFDTFKIIVSNVTIRVVPYVHRCRITSKQPARSKATQRRSSAVDSTRSSQMPSSRTWTGTVSETANCVSATVTRSPGRTKKNWRARDKKSEHQCKVRTSA